MTSISATSSTYPNPTNSKNSTAMITGELLAGFFGQYRRQVEIVQHVTDAGALLGFRLLRRRAIAREFSGHRSTASGLLVHPLH